MLNKTERKEFKHWHAIFEHEKPLPFGAEDVLRYDELVRKLDYTDHGGLCPSCFGDPS